MYFKKTYFTITLKLSEVQQTPASAEAPNHLQSHPIADALRLYSKQWFRLLLKQKKRNFQTEKRRKLIKSKTRMFFAPCRAVPHTRRRCSSAHLGCPCRFRLVS